MKRRKSSSSFPLLTACLLAVLFTACSAIKRGKVVKKGIDPVGTKMHPGPIHWVDVRGENSQGKIVTARIEFFEMDWKTIKKNDWIAPASYGVPRFFQRIHAYNEAQRAESGRFGAAVKVARKSKPQAPRRSTAARKPAGAPQAPPESVEPVKAPPAPPPPAPAKADSQRASRLQEVREAALEDPSVRELKARIKSADSNDEQQRAWREYRDTLRDKMHALDPSLGDLIDQSEASTQKP